MKPGSEEAQRRLIRAERQGLRLAIACRTGITGLAFIWYALGVQFSAAVDARLIVVGVLALFTLVGIAHLAVIGTRWDRAWMKFAVNTLDIGGICVAFALLPISRADDVPQIIAFRAYGIYYLFPLVALATLSLSPRLVLWTGAMAVLGWWAAFFVVVRGMDRVLSWDDMPLPATREDYEAIFLSIDFIGRGNRMEETALLFTATAVLALAVWRARRVFFAQVASDLAQAEERQARQRIGDLLGRYLPEEVARRLIADPAPLEPRVSHGVALVMDVAGFTARASGRDPREVIEELDGLLSQSSDAISRQGGVVITYLGDGLLATFGMPIDSDRPEARAIDAARALIEIAEQAGMAVRIGISSGPIASGNVGSSRRQSFTVYGDPVNRAARLEAEAKRVGAVLLVDAETRARAGVELNAFGQTRLRGVEADIELFGWPAAA